jgi:hypothetical protein
VGLSYRSPQSGATNFIITISPAGLPAGSSCSNWHQNKNLLPFSLDVHTRAENHMEETTYPVAIDIIRHIATWNPELELPSIKQCCFEVLMMHPCERDTLITHCMMSIQAALARASTDSERIQLVSANHLIIFKEEDYLVQTILCDGKLVLTLG